MKYNQLGNTGISVSKLCFGALTIGPLQANLNPEEGGEIIAHAFSKGVNFIDTAQLYGSYPHIHHALKKTGNKDIVIASKTYAYLGADAVAAVEQARTELDRDIIDIFLLHEQEGAATLRGHAEALEKLYDYKAKNIIKAVGISTHHVAGVWAAIDAKLDVVHPLLNLASLGIVDGSAADMAKASAAARTAGIGVYIMKPFGGGNLAARGEECLDYVLSMEFADSIAIGMQCKDEVDANIEYFETGHYTEAQKLALSDKKRRLLVEDWCDGCGECERACASSAIKVDMIKGQAVCTRERCVLCGYCGAACPQTCIKII